MEHYKKLLNQEFEWDSESLHFEEPVVCPTPQIALENVKKALLKTKKGKAAGNSCVVTKMFTACINRLTELFNQIILNEIIPEDWNTSIILSCFKKKMMLQEEATTEV